MLSTKVLKSSTASLTESFRPLRFSLNWSLVAKVQAAPALQDTDRRDTAAAASAAADEDNGDHCH